MSDDELTRIIRDIRESNEGFEISKDLDPDRPDRTMQAAEDLSEAVVQLEHWLDEHGPDALKSPYRSPGPPVGYGPRIDAVRRPWWRRLIERT